MITNQNYDVDLANAQDKKLLCDFSKAMYFDEKTLGNKNTMDKSLVLHKDCLNQLLSWQDLSNNEKQDFHQPILRSYATD